MPNARIASATSGGTEARARCVDPSISGSIRPAVFPTADPVAFPVPHRRLPVPHWRLANPPAVRLVVVHEPLRVDVVAPLIAVDFHFLHGRLDERARLARLSLLFLLFLLLLFL